MVRRVFSYVLSLMLALHSGFGYSFAEEQPDIMPTPLQEDQSTTTGENEILPRESEIPITTGENETIVEQTGIIISGEILTGLIIPQEEMLPLSLTGDIGDTEDIQVFQEQQQIPLQATSIPSLIITEVYFAGTDEWLEIYNNDDTIFNGAIQLSGAKSSLLTLNDISIPAKTARIFGDNMLMVTNSTVISKAGLSLSLSDTNPLAIELRYSGSMLDTFSATTGQTTDAKTVKASLEKTTSDSNSIYTSPARHNYNNDSAYQINPGIVYDTIADTAPVACETRGTQIQIREIFRGTEGKPPYIELYFPTTYNGILTITGTQITESFDINIDQPAGQYLLVLSELSGYATHPYRTDNQKLSFSSGLGNIMIYGQSGQVLDKVDVTFQESGYSSYVTHNGCERKADSIDSYSPGFSHDYLQYFPQGADKVITKQTIIHDTCSSGDIAIPVEPIATGEEVMEIVSIDYDPVGSDTNQESMTLRSLVDYPIDLSSYALRLSTRNGLQYLRGILEPDEDITLTGNFRFPNGGACVDILFEDFTVDGLCYPVDVLQTGEQDTDYSDLSITIGVLNYDPPGGDTNNEEITFVVHSGSVDFSQGFYLLINGRTHRLDTFVGIHTGSVTLKGNFRMANTKATCVSLLQQDFVFDTSCYEIPVTFGRTNTKPVNTLRQQYDIDIQHIIFNPTGNDTNKESVTLTLRGSTENIDLTDFRLLVNGIKKTIKGTLTPNQTTTFFGTFGFSNTKKTCVALEYEDHIYDTYCYNPSTDKEEIAHEMKWTGTVHIDSILFDPFGNDSGHEEIQITIGSGVIDLTQGWYLLVNNSKKNLAAYSDSSTGTVLLTGSFGFPNTKATCVSIRQYDTIFDEYCYDPQGQKDGGYTGIALDITAVLPNPMQTDKGKERVEIVLHTPDSIDLSQGFSLLVQGTKKELHGTVLAGHKTYITGSFALPNTASCISLLHKDTILDTFCYPKPEQGMIYTESTPTLQSLQEYDLALLNQTELRKVDNKLCLMLSEVTIKCKSIPAGKLATKQYEELKLSRNYIAMLHNYLANQRPPIYYNSDVSVYKSLFDTAKKDIGDGIFSRQYGSEIIPTADMQTRFRLQYQQPLVQQVEDQITTTVFTSKWQQRYRQAKEIYYARRE